MAGTRRIHPERLVSPAQSTGPAKTRRRGITLVELIVVISVMVLLLAVAVPAMRPALDGRRGRETARALNVYCGTAQGRAKELGRSCGIMLRRADGLPQCSMVIEQVEQPPPYAGDTTSALAALVIQAMTPNSATLQATLTDFSPALVHRFDLIQFNHQGPFYTIDGPDANNDSVIDSNTLVLKIDLGAGQTLPWPTAGPSTPMPYEVFRRPMKSSVSPLQLPAGAVIDLGASGRAAPVAPSGSLTPEQQEYYNPQNYTFFSWKIANEVPAATDPVLIMFSASGAIDRIYCWHLNDDWMNQSGTNKTSPKYVFGPVPVKEPIYLLIGRRNRILGNPMPPGTTALTASQRPNWSDSANLWVTLNPQTGMVTTVENNLVDLMQMPSGLNPPFDYGRPEHNAWALSQARQLARQAHGMGGR